MTAKTISWFLIITLAMVSSPGAAPQYDHEIVVIVKDGTIQMPPGATTAAVEDVIFNRPAIKQTLLNHTAQSVTVAFPDYDPSDTLFVTLMGNTIVRKFDLHLVYEIYLSDEQQRDVLNTKLIAYDEIPSSQNNGTVILHYDPRFGEQWGLHNTGQSGGTPDVDIDAPEAWQFETGDNTIVMGIVDWGVDLDHEDLAGKVLEESYGYSSHGTHVAGIAAAWADNNTGIAGVNWNAHFISKCRGDHPDTWNAVVELLGYNTLEAINCSWWLWGDIVLVHRAFAFAHNVGVALVASRGNAGQPDPTYPACFGDWMISVGAFTPI